MRSDSQEAIRRAEALLSGVAAATNSLLTIQAPDLAINKALEILGGATEVDRVYVFEAHDNPEKSRKVVSQRYEWCSAASVPQIDNLELQNVIPEEVGMDRIYALMESNQPINVIVSELPESEREVFELQQIKSMVVVPIFIEKLFWGFIGFDDCHSERPWTTNELAVLTAVAASIGGAVERSRARTALAAEKELLAVTLRSIGEGVISTDIHGKILSTNKVAESVLGLQAEEIVGADLHKVFQFIDIATQQKSSIETNDLIDSQRFIEYDDKELIIPKTGKSTPVFVAASPIHDLNSKIIGTVVAFRDVSEKRKLEAELNRSRNLESLGLLAGGIAHDFNNFLTGILGNLSIAKMNASSQDDGYAYLTKAEKASLQAKVLTQQLLSFSKGGASSRETVSMAKLLEEAVNFALTGASVTCKFSVTEDLADVDVDEAQINQVLNNLVINAIQATAGRGRLEVEAKNVKIDSFSGLPMVEGDAVRIDIKDNGEGIPQENLEKIFEPYFTTKEKGTGLGLAVCYSIIKKHGGHIQVDSEQGSGACFSIYLPASQRKAEITNAQQKTITKGEGRILVLDDEQIVRDVTGTMLKRLGYDVTFAVDGAESVRLYREASESNAPFDVVIMDLTIPGGMGGKEAAQEILETDPAARAIVSSGYSNDPIMSDFRKHGFIEAIVKPFRISELSHKISNIIASS